MTVMPLLPSAALLLVVAVTAVVAPRSFVLAVPAACVLVACLPAASRWGRHALPLLALALAMWHLPVAYAPWRGDYRGLAEFLTDHAAPADAMVFAPMATEPRYAGYTYLGLSHYAPQWPWPTAILEAGLPPTALADLRRSPAVWLVTPDASGRAPADLPGLRPDGMWSFPSIGTV